MRSESWNKMTHQRRKAKMMRILIIVRRKRRDASTFQSQTTQFMSSRK
jgi:hypothetical protein